MLKLKDGYKLELQTPETMIFFVAQKSLKIKQKTEKMCQVLK